MSAYTLTLLTGIMEGSILLLLLLLAQTGTRATLSSR
jgi:hypothetical protein